MTKGPLIKSLMFCKKITFQCKNELQPIGTSQKFANLSFYARIIRSPNLTGKRQNHGHAI